MVKVLLILVDELFLIKESYPRTITCAGGRVNSSTSFQGIDPKSAPAETLRGSRNGFPRQSSVGKL